MTVCEDNAVTLTPSYATQIPVCMHQNESCGVVVTKETRDMVLGNLNSTKCTLSGTNTTNAYSVRYTTPSRTNVQTINVFRDDVYAPSLSSNDQQSNDVEIEAAVITDLKTFEYNGTCALQTSDIQVFDQVSDNDRVPCVNFQLTGNTSKCLYNCQGSQNNNVDIAAVCAAHLRSLSPHTSLVINGACNKYGSSETIEAPCECVIETATPPNITIFPDASIPQPASNSALA